MSAAIDGEVWSIDGVPLYLNPGIEEDSNRAEFFRVKDIFIYNSINSLPINKGGVFIPRHALSNITGRNKEWVERSRQRIIDSSLPIVCYVNNEWIIDLTLVNNIYDTATLIV
jgi:hypothetical protein